MDVLYDHVSLTVDDVDKTIAFYEKHFGFKCVRRDRIPAGIIVDSITGIVGGELIAAFLTNGNFILEILEYTKQKNHAPAVPANQIGAPHIAFIVPSVADAFRDLSADGVTFIAPPVYNPHRGTNSVMLKDVDGIYIELRESSALSPTLKGEPFYTD